MGAARGIAGSRAPEQPGCFLAADKFECDWSDVWEVDGIENDTLLLSPEGYQYYPGVIPASQLRLVRQDLPPTLGP